MPPRTTLRMRTAAVAAQPVVEPPRGAESGEAPG